MKTKCCGRLVLCSKTTIYTFLLGGIFIALGSSRILLMKYSANEDNKYDYLPTTVNICSEVVKLVLCVILALWVKKKDHAFECLSWKNFCNSMKWSIPAFLYFLDNLIVFYVLSYLQPLCLRTKFSWYFVLATFIFRDESTFIFVLATFIFRDESTYAQEIVQLLSFLLFLCWVAFWFRICV